MTSSQSPPNAAERPRLTERQKKENHIRSEQKRREAIREGFDRLAAIVPGMEGQGRSEAVVLEATLQHMREQIAKRKELIAQGRTNGADTSQWELDVRSLRYWHPLCTSFADFAMLGGDYDAVRAPTRKKRDGAGRTAAGRAASRAAGRTTGRTAGRTAAAAAVYSQLAPWVAVTVAGVGRVLHVIPVRFGVFGVEYHVRLLQWIICHSISSLSTAFLY